MGSLVRFEFGCRRAQCRRGDGVGHHEVGSDLPAGSAERISTANAPKSTARLILRKADPGLSRCSLESLLQLVRLFAEATGAKFDLTVYALR